MRSPKKPRILHLLSDRNVGGVTATLGSLLHSRLGESFEFLALTVSEAFPKLKELRPDVIVWHDACSWRTLFQLWRLRRHAKLLIHEHHYSQGFEQWKVPSKFRFRWMLRIAYWLCDRVVAISYAQANWMRQYKLAPPQNLSIIQQCHTLEEFFTVPPKEPAVPLVLGVYGRFSQQKGIDTLLEAVRSIPTTPVRVLVGGYGEHEAKLRQIASSDDRIEFVGKLTNVPQFLSQCDVVAIPSRWEPWGNVCLEVKAAGKPAITAQIDGLTEQMTDCGLLVPPNDRQAWAQAIATVCEASPATLKTWGENGRHAIRDAWNTYLEQWEALYWQLLKPSSQPYVKN